MGGDLAVDEGEAALGVGDALAEAGGELRKEIAMIAGGGDGVAGEGGDLAPEQGVALGLEGGDVTAGVGDLAGEAEELGGGALAGGGGGEVVVIVEQALEGFGVAAGIGLVGAGHEEGEVLALGVVAGEVGMDALGEVAEEGFEGWRRIELGGLVGVGEGGLVGFAGSLAGGFGALAGVGGVVEIDLALGDAGLQVVELGVEDADVAEVAALKGSKLCAELGEVGFAVGEGGSKAGEVRALPGEGEVGRALLEDEVGWHAVLGRV